MTAGIVILNYNDYPTTLELVHQIYQFNEIDEIVVVDNNSTDNSFDVLFKKSKQLNFTLIRADKNGGYSYGNNLGIKYLIEHSNPDIIIIANPDVLFEEKIIYRIKQAFISNNDIGLLSPIMTDRNGKQMRMWLKLPSYINSLLDCSLIGRQINKLLGYKRINFSKPLFEVEKIPGSFMAFRSVALKEIGLFDDGVFLYYEENIIGMRMKQAGIKTMLLTDSSYIHNHSVTITKNMNVINSYRNNLKSKLYFEKTYRRIGHIRIFILQLFMKYGVLEKKILISLKNKSK